jgi:HEAT repeat protein
MGIFDIFKSKTKTNAPPPAAGDKNIARLGRVVGDRMSQTYDRMDAIEALAKLSSKEAVSALLKRFTFYSDPSISDQQEKEAVFHAILDVGENAIEPVVAFCQKAESLTWPLKILGELLEPEGFQEAALDLLEEHDTDYTRNVDPKTQLLASLEGRKGERVRAIVSRFLDDSSEPVRFQAVVTVLSLDDDAAVPALAALAAEEESLRVRNKVCEGLKARSWTIDEDQRAAFARAVSQSGFRLDADGHVV